MLGGIFVGTMGLFLLGVIQPKFMMKEVRFPFRKTNTSILNSLLMGTIFAAGWTPCIGPIFSSIIYTSVMNPPQTFLNVTAYSLGFSIPFIIMAFFIGKTRFILKYSSYLMKIGGFIMVNIGVLLYVNKMNAVNIWISNMIN